VILELEKHIESIEPHFLLRLCVCAEHKLTLARLYVDKVLHVCRIFSVYDKLLLTQIG
jgi:hypothetical protein